MKDKDGNSALILAASNGYDVDLRRLQAHKANPDAKNNFGEAFRPCLREGDPVRYSEHALRTLRPRYRQN